MHTKIKPIYKRVLLKISGESLQGKKDFGIDSTFLNRIIKEIKILISFGIQIAIVIGGGNLFRGSCFSNLGINRIFADNIGMLSTIINGLAIHGFMSKFSINSYLMSSFCIPSICEVYNREKAIKLISNNSLVIFAGGIGNPLFTTDSAACLRAIETDSEIVLKATNVNGVYSDDPKKNSNAIFYDSIRYKDVINNKLKIMDSCSLILARDYNLPIRVFNINKHMSIYKAAIGIKEGTLIYDR
ncbi:Uridylate kinase [Buchnera aphidicola (Neophyllaphis podocarpi)]|uniref:UMP kinase n=1 Tax=Buchnera aphidicola TaxID=9 RepID=UPI0031B81B1C